MKKVKKKNVLNRFEKHDIKEKIHDFEDNIKMKHKNNDKEKKKKDIKVTKKKTKEKKKHSFLKKILIVILSLAILGVLSVAGFLAYIVITAPEFDQTDIAMKDQTVIYDADGQIITTLAMANEKRESVTYDELPQVLIDAIIATEDSRFFQHNGVDLFRFIKAMIQQLLGQGEAGGASTLTMQIVKNNLTKKGQEETDPIKKIIRKFQDVYLAVFKVEKQYSKEEILEIYVNDNGLGSSYYGVEEASKYYFGKSVSDLTLPEAALIAGLFQAPNRHNPYYDIDSATERRRIVLTLMLRHGYITKEEKEIAEKIPVDKMLIGAKSESNAFQGFIDTVVAEVEKRTDRGDGTGGDNPYTVPMKIYTTMDRKMQTGIDKIYNDTSESIGKKIWKDEKVQAGVAIIEVETGAIPAVGAGHNKTGVNQFNYATMALRQPGSTAKPIFDYGPGIEYNNFSSYQLFLDEKWTYTNGPEVKNWDNKYSGLVTARYALEQSRNIPALKAFQQVGFKNSQKFVYSLGLDVALDSNSENYHIVSGNVDNTINEAYAIGGTAEGFTPLAMGAAYAAFANGGYYIEPHTVIKIEYRDTGDVIEYKYPKNRVMKDSTAYIMNNMLESVNNYGLKTGAKVSGSHVAAKTGTSNYDSATKKKYNLPSNAVNDVWTIAYTSKYAVSVWYGYKEADSKYYNTQNYPKEVLTGEVMKLIPKDTTGWKMPSSVVKSKVEKESWPAKLPSEYTPSDLILTEYFVRGTQPTEVSDRFKKLADVSNVETLNNNDNSVTITWTYQTPEVNTAAYLKNYFSSLGKNIDSLVNKRLEYNSEHLGNIVYNIYREELDGTQTLIDTVSNTSYTYTGYGNTTLVIKASYEKFKSNASNGIKINVALEDLDSTKLKVSLNGNNRIYATAGTYTEPDVRMVTYDGTDVTNNVTIKYQVSDKDNNITTYKTKEELETYINTLEVGTYTITYEATYLGINNKATRTVILSKKNN